MKTKEKVLMALVAFSVGILAGNLLESRVKYSAGTCLVSQNSPSVYRIDAVEKGRYLGLHVFGMAIIGQLDMPIAQLQADQSLQVVDCQTGEPVK